MTGDFSWATPLTCRVRSVGGLNAAFMDVADIAWKLPLVIRGDAKPSLLDSYAAEREIADHHMLEVSHEVHSFAMNLIAEYDGGGEPAVPVPDPVEEMASARRRSMLDISYAGSALVVNVAYEPDQKSYRRLPAVRLNIKLARARYEPQSQ
jgi:hypothetical protein